MTKTRHPVSQGRLFDGGIGLLIVVVSGVLYGLFSPAGLVSGDAAELAYGMKYLTTVHPPGYPLYITLGHAFVELTGLNYLSGPHLFSSLCLALSLGGVYWFLRRRSIAPVTSCLTVVVLGVSPVVWSIGVQTEVYALSLLFVVGTLIGWDHVTTSGTGLYFLWFWVGLSLTHHPTGLINIPFAIHGAVSLAREINVVRTAFFFVLPGSLYLALLVPGSGMPMQWPEISTLGALISHMLGGSFTRFLLHDGLITPFIQLKRTAISHFSVFPYLLLIPLLMGYVTLNGRERVIAWTQFGFLLFLSFYGVPDIQDFLVPSYLFSGIVFARGLQSFEDYFHEVVHPLLVILGVGSIVLFSYQVQFQYDRGQYDFYDSYVDTLDGELSRGTFVTDWARFTPIRFYKLDRDDLKHVQLVTLPLNHDLTSLVETHERRGIPIYTNLPDAWTLPPPYEVKQVESSEIELYQITQ